MKILKLPMTKFSTLIYFVNSFQPEGDSDQYDLVEEFINDLLVSMPEKTGKEPSDLAVENILNFARSYEVCKTKDAGYVEMNLN